MLQEKYLLSRAIADEVRFMGADAIITINEACISEPLPAFQYPADKRNKAEVISLTGDSKQGELLDLLPEIIRQRSGVRRALKKPEK